MPSTTLSIALVGNPNCGKTALFNRLTGARQKVANYAGVTVERKEGVFVSPAGTTIRVHDLPGMALRPTDDGEPAAFVVPEYFGQYEDAFDIQVQRPVREDRVADDGAGRLLVSTHHVDHPEAAVLWRARGLVNASGTWTKPFWPAYPGQWTFRGRQLHTRDFRTPDELADGGLRRCRFRPLHEQRRA